MIASLRELGTNVGLRRLALAYMVALVSLWAYSVAVGVFAFEVGGAGLVGVVSALKLLPAVFGAPFTAALSDRFPRRRVLVATAAVGAVVVGCAALAVLADLPPAVAFVLGGALVLVWTAFEPAKNAILPDLAANPRQLTAANAVTTSVESSSIFIGPALGAVALGVSGIGETMAAAAVLFGLSSLLLARIPEVREGDGEAEDGASGDAAEPEQADGGPSGVLAGFGAVRRDPSLRVVIGLVTAQTFVDGVIGVLVIVMAFELLDLGASGVGWLDACVGVGGLLGGALLLRRSSTRALGAQLGIGLVLWGVPLALIGLAPEAAVAFAMLAVVGIGNAFVDVSGMTLVQRQAPSEVLGRVLGVLESMIWASIALGSLAAPLLIEALGNRGALVAAGGLLPLLALLSARRLRAIDAAAPATRGLPLLRAQPLFAPLGMPTLEALASELEPREVAAGEEVVRQGESGRLFYLIEDGGVEVFEDGVRVREQGPGEYFGEIALLRDIPRTATVRALTDLKLLALEGESFVAAVSGHAQSAEEAEAVIGARLGSARRRVASL